MCGGTRTNKKIASFSILVCSIFLGMPLVSANERRLVRMEPSTATVMRSCPREIFEIGTHREALPQ